jgi:hypothetical protein
MPEIVADPLSPSCCHLFLRPAIQPFQQLGPDPFLPRARDACGRFVKGSSGNARGRPARHPQPQAAGARPCDPAADRAGAVGSDRPRASSVTAARRPALTTAPRFDRPGGQVLASVLTAMARGEITPAEGAQIAERIDARLHASRRLARLMRRLMDRPAIQTSPVRARRMP